MAEAHLVELRIRIVRAYESGDESYPGIAARFEVGEASVKRWVWLHRRTGGVEPSPKAGGTPSLIAKEAIEAALAVVRDNAGELTAEFNRGRPRRECTASAGSVDDAPDLDEAADAVMVASELRGKLDASGMGLMS